eukprot:jgi/Tetstr1/439618/TSEL_028040.t1
MDARTRTPAACGPDLDAGWPAADRPMRTRPGRPPVTGPGPVGRRRPLDAETSGRRRRPDTPNYPMALASVNNISMDFRKCGYTVWKALLTELQGSAMEERKRLE